MNTTSSVARPALKPGQVWELRDSQGPSITIIVQRVGNRGACCEAYYLGQKFEAYAATDVFANAQAQLLSCPARAA
jgi:hypothetical protein